MISRVETRPWNREQLFTFAQLAERDDLPIRKSRWVLRLWARRGVVINGTRERVKLESILIGHIRYTSIEALREFVARFMEHSQ